MSTRSERIKLLIEQSGKSYQDLEKITGIKKSSLQRYATGATIKIPLTVIEKLSKAFNVSQEYLMGWSENTKKASSPNKQELTEGEKMWLELYNRVSDETRVALTKMMCSFEKIPKDKQQLVLDLIRVALGNPK